MPWPSMRYYMLWAQSESYERIIARIVAFWLCSRRLNSPLCYELDKSSQIDTQKPLDKRR